LAYDLAGNLVTATNPRGYTTTLTYDALNRRTQTQDALGKLATVVFDAAGNVLATVDQRANRTTFAYDGLNQLTSRTDPLSHTNTLVYDLAGNVVRTIDPAGYTTTYAFDGLNRLTSTQAADGGIATTVYDAAGNVTTWIDPLGQRTTYVYDALDRLTQSTDARGGLTTTVYDAVGNTVNLIDAKNNTTTFVYDVMDRLTQQTDPLGHSGTFAYDLAGRLTSATDRNANRRDFRYDAVDRETGETWSASGSTANLLTYSYDSNGNLLTAANYNGAYTLTYDALDRTSAVQEPFGQALTFQYDAASNRTQVTDSQGGVTTSVYDAANRLTTREQANGLAPVRVDYNYTVRDQVAGVTRWADLVQIVKVGSTSYSYDAVGRMLNVRHQNSGATNLANLTYTYDQAGRVTSETTNGALKSFTYDATNQLTNDAVKTYTYDATGNRTMSGYQTGTGNQLKNDGVYTYTYDAEGNLTKKSKGTNGDTWTYGYDNANHLLWVKDAATDGGSATMLATYVYDALGNRIEKDVWQGGATTVTRFAYDGTEVWADLNGSNQLQTRYVWGDDGGPPLARVSAGTAAVAWYLPDREGSVRNLTDNSGVVQDTITYDGFGNVASESSSSFSDRYKYAGGEYDKETGLQHDGARYYDPATGRWLQQDPIGFLAGDPNLYRFVGNDPTNVIDPSGLDGTVSSGGGSGFNWFDSSLTAVGSGDAGWMLLPYMPGQGDSGSWSTLPYFPGQDSGSWVALADGGWQTLPYIPGQDSGSWSTLPYVPGQDNGSWVALADGGWQTLPYIPGQDLGSWSTLPYVPGQDNGWAVALDTGIGGGGPGMGGGYVPPLWRGGPRSGGGPQYGGGGGFPGGNKTPQGGIPPKGPPVAGYEPRTSREWFDYLNWRRRQMGLPPMTPEEWWGPDPPAEIVIGPMTPEAQEANRIWEEIRNRFPDDPEEIQRRLARMVQAGFAAVPPLGPGGDFWVMIESLPGGVRLSIRQRYVRPGRGFRPVAFKRWQRGEPIDKPMPDGNAPDWKIVQDRYWKNRYEEAKDTGEFTPAQLAEMRKGNAPMDYNPRTGRWERRELHHVIPRKYGGSSDPGNLRELTPDWHGEVDPDRKVRGISPSRGIR
jgi:RHS repeat-associated protein